MTENPESAEPTAHEKREQARKEREEAQRKREELKAQQEARKSYIWIGITLAVFIIFAVVVIYMIKSKPKMYTDREVHWHALVDISICGKHVDLPRAESSDTVHGKSYRGIHLLHTHDDNVIHIEGIIPKKEDIALGRFFDAIEVQFDKDKIMNVTNGDPCDGKPGMLKMYVNNQPRSDFRDYIPLPVQDARKQVIKLVFEPEAGLNAT